MIILLNKLQIYEIYKKDVINISKKLFKYLSMLSIKS